MDGGGRVYVGSDILDMLSLLDNSSNSLWLPSSSPSFHETMVNFDNHEIQQGPKRDRHRGSDGDDTGGEEFDLNPLYQPEKKRRLTSEQVEYLEKSFEVEYKLEPERKVQLAKELGLHPRQVAIWFQNRRARFKTKQLEKDYDSLKASYDTLKVDYDSLIKERLDLQNEVELLTKKLKQRDMVQANMDPDSPDNGLDSEPHNGGIPKTETEMVSKMEVVMAPNIKQTVEDASSAKSDVFDSDSPHCIEANHSSLLEDPAHMLESDPNGTSCNFSLVDDQPFWSWLY